MLTVEFNGEVFMVQVPEGYGFQNTDPGKLAEARTTELIIPAGILKSENNLLRISVADSGWCTWDALDMLLVP